MTNPANTNHISELPATINGEMATIGSVLLDPVEYVQIASFLKPDDFFLLRHNYIWQAFGRLYKRGDPLDHITVAEELDNMKVLSEIGGRAYLMKLVNSLAMAYNAVTYGRMVERMAIRRRMMEASKQIWELAQDEAGNITQIISEAESALAQATMGADASRDATPMCDAISEHYDDMAYRQQMDGVPGVPSGFRDVDTLLSGYPKAEMTVIAARPGHGKTSFALCLAMNMARMGQRVLFFSIEMTNQRLLDRMVSAETGINNIKISNGVLSPMEMSRYTEAIGRMSKWHVFLDDTSHLTPELLRARSQRINYQYGLDAIIVDYLQIMSSSKDYKGNDNARISDLSWQCKLLAKDLKVPVIVLSQLNRGVEQRRDKRPMLSDLRSSGSIEQDASVVQFIYRDELYNPETEFPNQADIITAKNRNGPSGVTSLYFEKSLTKFMDASIHRIDLSDLENI